MAETALHKELKRILARPGDAVEAPQDGYIIDIVRGDLLIEIQTGSFAKMQRKFADLLPKNKVHLIHPIPLEKWIVRAQSATCGTKRRKSPKHGRIEHLFEQMVYIPDLISHPNFSMEILLTKEVEYWENSGGGSWRRKGWQITDRQLLSIQASRVFSSPADYRTLLPDDLPQPFTTLDLAQAARLPRRLAQKMVYCLKRNGLIQMEGKIGRAYSYRY